MHAFRQERMVSGSYRCYWRACWSYIEVIMFLHLRPLLERAALNRFSFFSKHLHCVKVLLSTALNPELLIVTLELALTITNAVIFNWQISKRKLCFSIHVIQSHSTCKLREIQLRTQTVLVMHRLQYVTFVNIDSWDGKQYVGRGGGGSYLAKFYSERLRHEAQPLTLYINIPLFTKGTPSVYLSLKNGFTYLLKKNRSLKRRSSNHCCVRRVTFNLILIILH